MIGLWFDLKMGIRSLARSPGYTAVSLLMLASGLGLTIFMFSAVKAYMLTDLPFVEPERIMHVELLDPRVDDDDSVNPHEFREWQEQQHAFDALGGFYGGTVNLSGDDRPERYRGAFVSANFFDILKVAPVLGRGFVAGDDEYGAPLAVVIGHELWRHRYNEDPGVVGTVVRVNGRDAEIVGVMPAGFRFPERENIWVAHQQDLATLQRGDGAHLGVFGRLRDGVTQAQAQAMMQTLHTRLLADADDTGTAPAVVVQPYAARFVSDTTRGIVGTLFACVVFVLLIACSNVANLTLARTTARRREIAVRASLGAGRRRLIGGILAEVVVVSVAGAALGLLFAHWAGFQVERAMIIGDDLPPYWVDGSIDATVAFFAFALALGSALVAGFLPAWRASRADLNGGLRDGGYGASHARQGRLARLLVSFQVALCCVLLICAGLTLRSMVNVNSVDDGLGHRTALTGRIGLFEASFPEPADRVRAFEQLQRELEIIPGARAATVATGLPFADLGRTDYLPAGRDLAPDARWPSALGVVIQPNYFETFGVAMQRGRAFNAADNADAARVAIVNASLAATEWPGRDAVGETLQLNNRDGTQLTVVGVVNDFVQDNSDFALGRRPALYVPLAQHPQHFVSFAVATDGDPHRLAPEVRAAMLRVDPDTPIYWLRSLDEVMAIAKFNQHFLASLFGIIGAFAVLLATSGIYAVLGYAVGQRTREIGVRRALGAADSSILRMVAEQGGRQYLVGIGVGLIAAALFARLIANQLVGVSTFDPLTFAGVVLLLGVAAAFAAWLPARRALKVQPVVALRQD